MEEELKLKDKILIRGQGDYRYKSGPDYKGLRRVTRGVDSYYVVDLNSWQILFKIPDTNEWRSMVTSTYAVGTEIYILGVITIGNQVLNDDDDLKCSVFSYDLTKPRLGWKTIEPPLNRDDFHSEGGVEFQGKIYLVRGSEYRCRCEVFDPQFNQWNRFKSPPYYSKRKKCTIYVEPPVMADLKNGRIIVWLEYPKGPCNASLLCAYYPNEDRWVVVAEDFRGWYRIHLHPLVAFVEGVIYVFDPICVTLDGFDLSNKEWFIVDISPDHEDYLPPNFRYDSLLHRGNGLLYVFGSTRKFGTIDGASSDDTIETIVRAVEFKVEITDKKPHLTWISSRTFQIDESCNIFHYVLV